MRDRSFILIASVLALLFIAAGALLLYDQSRDDRVAEGVRVAGIDIGGLDAPRARDRLRQELGAGLTPIVVRGEGKSFELTPRQAGATYDYTGMVDAAVRRSRGGNVVTRTWRDIRGTRVDMNLPAELQYSHLVVNRFVRRVDDAISRKPVDAHLKVTGGYPKRVPGKDGLHVSFPQLRADVTAALTGRDPDRTVVVRPVRVKPKVVRAGLAEAYPYLITVDRPNFKLRFFRHLKLVKTYTVAIGQVGYDTPAGEYPILNKAVNPAWSVPSDAEWAGPLKGKVIPSGSPQNPLKARWLGFGGGRGIHGTADSGSLGSAASHGCIRMAVPEVIELYEKVPVGTPLYIA